MSEIQYLKAILTTEQVRGMFVTPVTIVQAPGLNNVIVVHNFGLQLDWVSQSFERGGDVSLIYGDKNLATTPGTFASQTISRDLVNSGGARVQVVGGKVGTKATGLGIFTSLVNMPVSIAAAPSNFQNGDGRLYAHVWYSIISIT